MRRDGRPAIVESLIVVIHHEPPERVGLAKLSALGQRQEQPESKRGRIGLVLECQAKVGFGLVQAAEMMRAQARRTRLSRSAVPALIAREAARSTPVQSAVVS